MKAIDSTEVDILALQEATEGFKDAFPEIGLVCVKSVTSGDSSSLIANWWPVKTLEAPREESVLSAIIKIPCGEIEVHNVQVSNASQNGHQTKVDTFKGIYKTPKKKTDRHRILCGDFNSPKKESSDGITHWGSQYAQRAGEKMLSCLKEYGREDT